MQKLNKKALTNKNMSNKNKYGTMEQDGISTFTPVA